MGGDAGAVGRCDRHEKRSGKAFAFGAVQGFQRLLPGHNADGSRRAIAHHKEQPSRTLEDGDLRHVQSIDGNMITLDNGYKLDTSKPLHIRQGYTMTSQASQGHENPKMFAFLPVSATSQINAVQMLISLSRASREVRLYTDSKAVLREAAIRPGQGASAIELIDGEPKPEVDLWQVGHNGDKTQKEPELIRELRRARQMTKREQICETVRKTANREIRMERCIER
jgi:hypothetical protein